MHSGTLADCREARSDGSGKRTISNALACRRDCQADDGRRRDRSQSWTQHQEHVRWTGSGGGATTSISELDELEESFIQLWRHEDQDADQQVGRSNGGRFGED